MTKSSDDCPAAPLSAISSEETELASLEPARREAYEWVARFTGGDMTSDDVEAMKAWYRRSAEHADAYAEARRVWQSLGPVARASLSQAHAGQNDRLRPRVAAASLPSRRLFLGGAIAASAAAYMVARPPLEIWPSYAELTADFRTGTGERRQVMLSDQAALELNTRTSIALRSPQTDGAQIELLSGETAISTRATSPLTVLARNGRISSVDADFNLRCDDQEVAISCLRGNLTVERSGVTTALSARQQTSYGHAATAAVTAVDPETVTAWQRGLLIFDFTPVSQVIAEVNRYRQGRIILLNGDIGRRLLSASLPVTQTDKIVVQIVHIFGAKARELPGGIVVLT